jgi:hypothetical protein
MATWTVKIEVTNAESKLVSVTGTRTDGANVRVYRLDGVSVDTHDVPLATIKTVVVNNLYAQYVADVAGVAAKAAMIAGWESAVATALNAKET